MRSTRHALVGLFAAATLAVTAACTEDDLATPEETDAPDVPEQTAPATEDAGDGTEVAPGDVTPPGTGLSVGDGRGAAARRRRLPHRDQH